MTIHLPNLVCRLVGDALSPEIAHESNLLGQRELWGVQPGDILVTPLPVPPSFRRYTLDLLNVPPDSITLLAPQDIGPTETLVGALRREGLIGPLSELVRRAGGAALQCYGLDHEILELARDLGVGVSAYDRPPSREVLDLIQRLSTKTGFRCWAEQCGLRTVRGKSCAGLDQLIGQAEQLLQDGDIIVKYDSGAGGDGHLIVRRDESFGRALPNLLTGHISRYPRRSQRFVVEQLMPFDHLPTVELNVDTRGVWPAYIGEQRCRDASFTGMMVPPPHLAPEVHHQLLCETGTLATYLRRRGYCGVCNFDAGVVNGRDVYYLEANLRRTGGTHLHSLVRRLVGGRAGDRIWIADTQAGGECDDFSAGQSRLAMAGLAFHPSTHQGVILTSDTVKIDHTWRYLIIARDPGQAIVMEANAKSILGLKTN